MYIKRYWFSYSQNVMNRKMSIMKCSDGKVEQGSRKSHMRDHKHRHRRHRVSYHIRAISGAKAGQDGTDNSHNALRWSPKYFNPGALSSTLASRHCNTHSLKEFKYRVVDMAKLANAKIPNLKLNNGISIPMVSVFFPPCH